MKSQVVHPHQEESGDEPGCIIPIVRQLEMFVGWGPRIG